MRSRNRVSRRRMPTISTGSLTAFIAMSTLVVAVGCGGGSTSAVKSNMGPVAASLSGTIAVGTTPVAIAVDSTNNKIFVGDLGSFPPNDYPQGGCYGTRGDVSAIDGSTQSTTSMAIGSGGLFPNVRAVTVDAASHTAYVVTWEGFALKGALSCGVIQANLTGFDGANLNQTL